MLLRHLGRVWALMAPRVRRDAALFVGAFAMLVALGMIVLHWPRRVSAASPSTLTVLALALALFLARRRVRNRWWHILANVFSLGEPKALKSPWVIDGDTIDDRASSISVRRTSGVDQYGRRVAFVLADGADLGELLVASRLARPWRGRRVRWCGPRGALAQIARETGVSWSCQYCRHWRG